MGKRRFRKGRAECAGYPTREEFALSRRQLLAGLGALVGVAGLLGCGTVATQGEPVMPDTDAGALVDAGAPTDSGLADSGTPDAQMLAGEPELPDGGAK